MRGAWWGCRCRRPGSGEAMAAPSPDLPRGPGLAPVTQKPVSYYGTFFASDCLANKPIWGPPGSLRLPLQGSG